MKKTILIIILTTCCFISCKQKPEAQKLEVVPLPSVADKELIGFWVGDFKAMEYKDDQPYTHINKINIAIKTVVKDSVFGQSTVAGNSRPILGTLKREEGKIYFILAEPADDKYDGRFDLNM